MSIEVRFERRQGDFTLSAAFTAPGRGITALFGHSGSGKTTLLRLIAGLERGDGRLVVNGEVWQDAGRFLPVHRRPLGYVFQEASLFAHLSVRRNLEYGLRRVARAERRVALDNAVELLGLGHLLERNPARLSGGERQRVAIARALLTSPQLLLMDEPLSALDEKSKQEILPFLERLHDELAIPVFYVSHSLKEVTRLADHMVWLEQGRVAADGSLSAVLARLDVERAWEKEAGAVLDAVVVLHDDHYHLTAVDTRCGRLWIPRIDTESGRRVRIRLAARDISLSLEPDRKSSILNVWPTEVEAATEVSPGQLLVRLGCPLDGGSGESFVARITTRSWHALELEPGTRVYARIKSVAIVD